MLHQVVQQVILRAGGAALLPACGEKHGLEVRLACDIFAILQGYVYNGSSGEFSAADKMKEVLGMMATYGNVAPDRRTYALQVEGFLKNNELEVRISPTKKLSSASRPACAPKVSWRRDRAKGVGAELPSGCRKVLPPKAENHLTNKCWTKKILCLTLNAVHCIFSCDDDTQQPMRRGCPGNAAAVGGCQYGGFWMLQDAVESFFAMREKASGPVIALPPAVLAELLAAVADAGLPADLLRILRCLEADQQRLPGEAMQPTDEEGHTFLSAWLVPRYLRLRARANKSSLAIATGAGNGHPHLVLNPARYI